MNAPGRRGEPTAPPLPAPLPPVAAPPPMALVFSITVTGILANALIPAALPDLRRDLGLAGWQAGLVITASTIPGIVVAPLIGLLADRFGRREVLVPCLASFGVFGGLSALAPSFPALLALRFGQGIGSAGLINLAVVLIADHWDGLERARRIGQNAAVLTASFAVVPPIGGLLTGAGGWRASFAPYVAALGVAVVVHRRLAPAGGARPSVSLAGQARAMVAVARQPPVAAVLALAVVVFAMIFGLILTVLPLRLDAELGLSERQIGVLVASSAIGSTVSSLSLGRLRHRFTAATLVASGLGLFAAGFAVIGATSTVVLIVTGAVIYGLGEGAIIPTLQDRAAGLAPPDQRGSVVATWVGFVRLGQAIGPATLAALYEATGAATTFAAGVGLTLAAAALSRLALAAPPPPAPAPPGTPEHHPTPDPSRP